MKPDRCPFGHALGPRQFSLSWDMQRQHHDLYCNGCGGKTRLPLTEASKWEIRESGEWVTYR